MTEHEPPRIGNDELIYREATKAAQANCDQAECADPNRSYVCTYHLGWADGFEAAQAAAEPNADLARFVMQLMEFRKEVLERFDTLLSAVADLGDNFQRHAGLHGWESK
jgi:hypothetical protein